MTKVICYFSGPGSGKSTTAAMVFSLLKMNNISAELITEYAKDIVWQETHNLLRNQLDILSEQFKRQWRVKDKVDYIVTDSPILLQSFYADLGRGYFSEAFIADIKELCVHAFNEFDNVNFFIGRNKPYHTAGRNQSEDEAKELDRIIRNHLEIEGIPFYHTNSIWAVNDTIDYLNKHFGHDIELTFHPKKVSYQK